MKRKVYVKKIRSVVKKASEVYKIISWAWKLSFNSECVASFCYRNWVNCLFLSDIKLAIYIGKKYVLEEHFFI